MTDLDAMSAVQLWTVCLCVASIVTCVAGLMGLLDDDEPKNK